MTEELGPEPVRFSRLSKMARSAAHYACGVYEETAAMRIGSATHSFLLGDETAVAVYPGPVRRGKEYEAFAAEHEGAVILLPSELRAAEGMRESILKHARAVELLNGTREKTHHWKWMGRYCRGTPDVFTADRIVELKTTRSSDPRKFPFQARSMHYPSQLAWYQNGLELAGLPMPPACFIVAVESAPPYPVVVYDLTTELIEQGLRSCRLWMERLKVCEETRCFPAYAESDVTLDIADNELDLDFAGVEE